MLGTQDCNFQGHKPIFILVYNGFADITERFGPEYRKASMRTTSDKLELCVHGGDAFRTKL